MRLLSLSGVSKGKLVTPKTDALEEMVGSLPQEAKYSKTLSVNRKASRLVADVNGACTFAALAGE